MWRRIQQNRRATLYAAASLLAVGLAGLLTLRILTAGGGMPLTTATPEASPPVDRDVPLATATPETTAERSTEHADAPSRRIYTVQPGDGLARIALRECGVEPLWPEITQIDGSPLQGNLIRPDQQLLLPAGCGAVRADPGLAASAGSPGEHDVEPAPGQPADRSSGDEPAQISLGPARISLGPARIPLRAAWGLLSLVLVVVLCLQYLLARNLPWDEIGRWRRLRRQGSAAVERRAADPESEARRLQGGLIRALARLAPGWHIVLLREAQDGYAVLLRSGPGAPPMSAEVTPIGWHLGTPARLGSVDRQRAWLTIGHLPAEMPAERESRDIAAGRLVHAGQDEDGNGVYISLNLNPITLTGDLVSRSALLRPALADLQSVHGLGYEIYPGQGAEEIIGEQGAEEIIGEHGAEFPGAERLSAHLRKLDERSGCVVFTPRQQAEADRAVAVCVPRGLDVILTGDTATWSVSGTSIRCVRSQRGDARAIEVTVAIIDLDYPLPPLTIVPQPPGSPLWLTIVPAVGAEDDPLEPEDVRGAEGAAPPAADPPAADPPAADPPAADPPAADLPEVDPLVDDLLFLDVGDVPPPQGGPERPPEPEPPAAGAAPPERTLHVELLGSFRLSIGAPGEERIRVRLRPLPVSLLTFLATARALGLHGDRTELAQHLRPGRSDTRRLAADLRHASSDILEQAPQLDLDGILLATRTRVVLDEQHISSDLLQFRQLSADAAAAASRGDRPEARAGWRAASALIRGTPLASESSDWAANTRIRLQQDIARELTRAVALAHGMGRTDDVREFRAAAERAGLMIDLPDAPP